MSKLRCTLYLYGVGHCTMQSCPRRRPSHRLLGISHNTVLFNKAHDCFLSWLTQITKCNHPFSHYQFGLDSIHWVYLPLHVRYKPTFTFIGRTEEDAVAEVEVQLSNASKAYRLLTCSNSSYIVYIQLDCIASLSFKTRRSLLLWTWSYSVYEIAS